MPKRPRGPVGRALRDGSSLRDAVRPGIQAVRHVDRGSIDEDIRADFVDSIELDAALRARSPDQPRWDYLLGHRRPSRILALEVHPATDGEVGTVIEKKRHASAQLRDHLRDGHGVARWYWAASGTTALSKTGSSSRRLSQAGILFVGRRLLRKHIDRGP